jgi:hypothetical protein
MGSTPFTFVWQAESPVNSGNFVPLVSGPAGPNHSISGATTRTLILTPRPGRSLPTSVATRYRCVISNACNTVTSQPALVSLCRADYNCSGAITVQDIFDFLDDWFGSDLFADFNASGTLTVQDVFDYLDAWFIGCP